MNYNINFCIDPQRKNIYYCYNECQRKRCPTISNLWYGYIVIPLIQFIAIIKNRFVKCNKSTKCDFLVYKKYCALKGRCK